MSTFSHWKDVLLYGWSLDNFEAFRNFYNSSSYGQMRSWDEQIESYKNLSYNDRIEPIFKETNINFNLGGENDKSKLEFTSQPIGVFDFSSASVNLYRVHEFYSQGLKDKLPNRFLDYQLPSGIVPNYFVEKKIVQNQSIFIFKDIDGSEYLCSKRQKGLTVLLEEDPFLPTVIQEGTNMLIPLNPTSKVKFASKTKKPYLKYKRQGGKVRYVEIYSANYYTRMEDDFQFAVRHIPMMMVAKYLEKMGTMTKLYMTRFVNVGGIQYPRENDIVSRAKLPLYIEFKEYEQRTINLTRNLRNRFNIILPMCVKDYGEEIDLPQFFAVGSLSHRAMYESAGQNMAIRESDGNMKLYGNPDWTEEQYQEGFERFRQKYAQYVDKGIWKAKEVTAQGLIFFHDLVLNTEFNTHTKYVKSALNDGREIEQIIITNQSVAKWFELWMQISALTIKDKFEIFNSNNPTKTYREIIQQMNNIIFEIEMMIRTEQNAKLKAYFKDLFLPLINNQSQYTYSGRLTIAGYGYSNPIQYISDKINEMTIYAKEGYFETPKEDIETRNKEAERLLIELTKI